MPKREFKNWIESFVDYAKYGETPEKFLYWSAIAAIGGALERRVWIDQWRFQVFPNFYIIFVAKAGRIQKSTALNFSMDLLRKLPQIRFAPKSTTWEGLINKMDQLHGSDNIGLHIDTPNTKTAAVMIVSSEFSVFFDPKNKGMVSALTDLWDCPPDFDKFTVYRQDEFLEKPCLNIFGATTPSWVRESFDRWTKEGGFASRAIFLYADKKHNYVAWPKRAIPAGHLETRNRLISDLRAIGRLAGEYKLTEDTYKWGEQWYKEHCQVLEASTDEATGFKDRKQVHVLKLAMVLAAAQSDTLIITLDHFKEAVKQIDAVEGDFDSVFGILDQRQELRPFNDLSAYLKSHPVIEYQSLVREMSRKYLYYEITRALDGLIASGQAKKVTKDGKVWVHYGT